MTRLTFLISFEVIGVRPRYLQETRCSTGPQSGPTSQKNILIDINLIFSMIFSSNSNTSFLTLHVTAKRRPRRLGLAKFFGKIIRLLKVSHHNRGGLALVLYQFFLHFKIHFMKILQRQHLRNLQIMMHSFNIFCKK